MTPFRRSACRPLMLLAMLVAGDAFATTPVYETQWGVYGSGNGQFKLPSGIDAVVNVGWGQNLVYVADTFNDRIQTFQPAGPFFAAVGSSGSGNGQLSASEDVTARANIYATDLFNNRVQVWSYDGTYIGGFGSAGSGPGQFDGPVGIAVDASGYIYITDANNHRIQKFHDDGGGVYSYVAQWGSMGSGVTQFRRPARIALGADGNLYIADEQNHRVLVHTTSGAFVRTWGSQGATDGKFFNPSGIAVGPTGNVFVADKDNNRIQQFTSTGTYINQWGTLGAGPLQFRQPTDVAVDADGKVYVADTGNHRIGKYSADVASPVVTLTSPVGGESWSGATLHPITWTATDNVGVATIDLAYSTNGGATWSAIATGFVNTGAYNWNVPNLPTSQARVRVTAHDVNGNLGTTTSGDFTVVPGAVDVEGAGSPRLSLARPVAERGGGTVTLQFTTPGPGPARIDILDLAGRRVWSWSESALPAGDHSVDWDGHGLSGAPAATGVYYVRLSAAAGTRAAPLTLLR